MASLKSTDVALCETAFMSFFCAGDSGRHQQIRRQQSLGEGRMSRLAGKYGRTRRRASVTQQRWSSGSYVQPHLPAKPVNECVTTATPLNACGWGCFWHAPARNPDFI